MAHLLERLFQSWWQLGAGVAQLDRGYRVWQRLLSSVTTLPNRRQHLWLLQRKRRLVELPVLDLAVPRRVRLKKDGLHQAA